MWQHAGQWMTSCMDIQAGCRPRQCVRAAPMNDRQQETYFRHPHLHVATTCPLTYATTFFSRTWTAPGTFETPTDSLRGREGLRSGPDRRRFDAKQLFLGGFLQGYEKRRRNIGHWCLLFQVLINKYSLDVVHERPQVKQMQLLSDHYYS